MLGTVYTNGGPNLDTLLAAAVGYSRASLELITTGAAGDPSWISSPDPELYLVTNPVPEPSTSVLGMVGLTGLITVARWKKFRRA